MKKLSIVFFVIIALLGFGLSVQAAPAQKVAVLPFSVNAEKDMTFLQQGIYDMLTNRLQTPGSIDIVPKQTVVNAGNGIDVNTTEGRRALANKIKADYVVGGVLTVLGESVSVDVRVTAADSKISERTFSDMSQDMGAIINKMDGIARNIKNYVNAGAASGASTGGNITVDLPQVADAGSDQDGSATGPGSRTKSWTDDVDSRTNPETAFKREMMSGQAYALLSDNEDVAQALLLNYWKGPAVNYSMMAIAIGDIDGDGLNETVVASHDTLYIYRMVDNNFYSVGTIPLEGSAKVISMDIADINRNGAPQIFLTRLNVTRQGLSSTVLQYSNGKYNVIADKLSYYLRVVNTPTRGPILLGQKHILGAPFQRNLTEMSWEGGQYVEDSRWRTSWPVNAIGSTLGEIMGEYWVLGYDDGDFLRVFNDKGAQNWESGGPRGGNSVVYELSKNSGSINYAFLPSRVQMRNLKNSPNQIVIAVNEDAIGRKLANTRNFTDFMLYGYRWDGLDMELVWKTRKTKGFARDFIVGDFDNDGHDEVVIALVQSEGDSPLTTARGAIIAYELPEDN